ncbi:DUF2795 domain-containing protein [Pseudonocardia sp.]|uniref:DUF2795 domain-containing protein n=1 Tax=Pseudonocardia sp. TaxID=60912 RepID=UPI002607F3F3|nr:DUF2795 domain-containing protein [Pseudonocardia sp.]
MMRRGTQADLQRVRHVLAGLAFPAAKWQLIIHAEDYGADASTRAELWALPPGDYPDLPAVFVALGLASVAPRRPPAQRPAYRVAPAVQVAARDSS